MLAELIFATFVFLIIYTYIGYPLLVFLLSAVFPRPVRTDDFTPKVSVIIAAHNEEQNLASKIENTLALDYPQGKLEVIVASDCSTDRTEEIALQYAERGVILYRQRERHGKTMAQKSAVKVSSGEILVFSDATTGYEPDSLRNIVRMFADSEVGCVAGQLVYVDRSVSAVGRGCRSYWSYEKFIKRCESRLGSLIGVSGCLYAVRRSCQVRLANQMIDDFVIATEIHLQGLRTVYEPEAVSTEDTNKRGRDEFRMRVRVIAQTMRAVYRYRKVLSLRRHGLYAFQMLSHKVLRYAVPLFLIAVLISNWLLVNESEIYRYTFLSQLTLYAAAIVGWGADGLRIRLGPLALPYYFVLVNLASLVAFVRFVRGGTQVVWEPLREAKAQQATAKPQLASK